VYSMIARVFRQLFVYSSCANGQSFPFPSIIGVKWDKLLC
jgi:hypothetical protein